MEVFIDWFNRVWKRAPNEIERELGRPQPDGARIEALGVELGDRLDVFEAMLAGREHLMGDELSAADCVAFPFLKYAAGREPADTDRFHEILERHQALGED